MISDENILEAIRDVNKTHRWRRHHRPNKIVEWVESDIPARVNELRQIIEDGYIPSECTVKTIYDVTSEKYREIHEPKLWPDQYIHHILVQVIKEPIMRRMDHWVCGSIPKRGTHYGVRAISKWMRNPRKTKYCAELDIRHFYQNIEPKIVIESLLKVIKDRKVIDLAERILTQGVAIGFYTSQWFANLVLQDMDIFIRMQSTEYVRYMDNITVFHSNKRKLHKLVDKIAVWLDGRRLRLKYNWQVFRTKCREPQALGYRFGNGYILPRKRNLFRLKRQLSRVYKRMSKLRKATANQARGLMSRLGQLCWCNSTNIRNMHVKTGLIAKLKNIIRTVQRKERLAWI